MTAVDGRTFVSWLSELRRIKLQISFRNTEVSPRVSWYELLRLSIDNIAGDDAEAAEGLYHIIYVTLYSSNLDNCASDFHADPSNEENIYTVRIFYSVCSSEVRGYARVGSCETLDDECRPRTMKNNMKYYTDHKKFIRLIGIDAWWN